MEHHDREQPAFSSLDHAAQEFRQQGEVKAPPSLLPTVMNHLGLGQNQSRAISSLEPLVVALESADWHKRATAVRALGELKEDVLLEPLLAALDDEDESVRATAIIALGKRRGTAATDRLVMALHDPAWLVRETAVLTLGNLGEPTVVEHLGVVLDDENEFVREAAQRTLQQARTQALSTHTLNNPFKSQGSLRERLLQNRTSSSLHPISTQRGEMGSYAKPVSSKGGPSQSSRGFQGASRGPRLSTIAAVLCAALLVSSFILLFPHVHQTGSGRVKPENTPATGKHAGPITSIHMLDANTGWAVNNNTNRILHTTAGVTHWQDVTPPVDGQSSTIAGTDFFSRSTAWVAVIDGTRLFVYRTHDGGQSWQKAQPPDRIGSSYHMTFLNARVGWLLVGNVVAMDQEAVDVLQTRDGGVSWKVISAFNYNLYFNNPAGFQNPTGLSVEGHKTGVSFVNETTGWATASTAAGRIAWLYITHDGGVSWQQQSIPEPPDAFQEWETLPPVFFNATDGILPHIFLLGPQSQTLNETLNLYVTHNGGASWSATPAVSPSATAGTLTTIPDGAIDFVDARHGWFASNTFNVKSYQYLNSTVYRTSDGGQRWTQYTVRLNADITMIDFVSRAQGWAIDSAQALYQTTDGGQTWTKVN